MSAYPNPADDHITIKFKLNTNDPAVINVYNSIGQLVKTWKPKFVDQTQHCFFSISDVDFKFAPGIYYMKLSAGSEQHDLKFIVK